MNRIFLAMILVAFGFAAWGELMVPPPTPPEPVEQVEIVPGLGSTDPTVAALAAEVAQLKAASTPKPAPVLSPMRALQDALLGKAKAAVELVLGLMGAMAFFLGVMKVAEDAGLLAVIARAIQPLMRRLFPDVPVDHPAMGAMILNLSANVLGLGNAATPFGIRAMQELDKLNRTKGTTTNAMALFLAINTSSVTLLPTGVIVWRKTLGSMNPAAILPTTLAATFLSTATAVIACKVLARWSAKPESITPAADIVELEPHTPEAVGASWPEWASWLALVGIAALIPVTLWAGEALAVWFVPGLVVGLLGYGGWKGVPVYESFVAGARSGWDTGVRIVPYLVAILVAVGMLQASGAMDALVAVLDPITRPLGLPGEALPMALLRPLSGSGALGVMVATMSDPATGPDTYVGMIVSTLMGSTETTFYVLAVYFGAVGIHRLRHALWAALLADLAGVVGTVVAVRAWMALS